jgi:hypothetical protein
MEEVRKKLWIHGLLSDVDKNTLTNEEMLLLYAESIDIPECSVHDVAEAFNFDYVKLCNAVRGVQKKKQKLRKEKRAQEKRAQYMGQEFSLFSLTDVQDCPSTSAPSASAPATSAPSTFEHQVSETLAKEVVEKTAELKRSKATVRLLTKRNITRAQAAKDAEIRKLTKLNQVHSITIKRLERSNVQLKRKATKLQEEVNSNRGKVQEEKKTERGIDLVRRKLLDQIEGIEKQLAEKDVTITQLQKKLEEMNRQVAYLEDLLHDDQDPEVKTIDDQGSFSSELQLYIMQVLSKG